MLLASVLFEYNSIRHCINRQYLTIRGDAKRYRVERSRWFIFVGIKDPVLNIFVKEGQWRTGFRAGDLFSVTFLFGLLFWRRKGDAPPLIIFNEMETRSLIRHFRVCPERSKSLQAVAAPFTESRKFINYCTSAPREASSVQTPHARFHPPLGSQIIVGG